MLLSNQFKDYFSIKKIILFVALIYFFFNSFLLPKGMLYTMFLTPVFYYWLQKQGHTKVLLYFVIATSPWLLAHLLMNHNFTNYYYYIRSYGLVFTVYLFVYTLVIFLKKYKECLPVLFEKITLLNLFFTIIAIFLLFTPYWNLMWIDWWVSPSVGNMLRLSQLTYEPSYYSTLFVPIFLFFLLNTIQSFHEKKNHLLLISLVFPLALSFSMGVLSGLFLATIVVIVYYVLCIRNNDLSPKKGFFMLLEVIAISLISFACLMWLNFFFLYINNNQILQQLEININEPVTERLFDIVKGKDSSGKGRTFQSFEVAYLILKDYNMWFGVGFGQVKVIGKNAFEAVFHYVPQEVTLLNTLAETLANLGIIGILVRFIAEISLFFYTKTYTNYFRLLIFIYIFIYQFTGSFYTNIAEYVLWAFAFVNSFPQFDVKSKYWKQT